MDTPKVPKNLTVTEDDLPIYCPPKDAERWQLHPRVFLPINLKNKEANCPYCGTYYRLTTK